MSTALVKFSVENARSLDELIREADAEAIAMVGASGTPTFHSARITALTSTGTVTGDFTYEVPVPDASAGYGDRTTESA